MKLKSTWGRMMTTSLRTLTMLRLSWVVGQLSQQQSLSGIVHSPVRPAAKATIHTAVNIGLRIDLNSRVPVAIAVLALWECMCATGRAEAWGKRALYFVIGAFATYTSEEVERRQRDAEFAGETTLASPTSGRTEFADSVGDAAVPNIEVKEKTLYYARCLQSKPPGETIPAM